MISRDKTDSDCEVELSLLDDSPDFGSRSPWNNHDQVRAQKAAASRARQVRVACGGLMTLAGVVWMILHVTKARGFLVICKNSLDQSGCNASHAPPEWGELTKIGTKYGGYPIFLSRVKETSALFSFGLGDDISFDKALMKATNATVHGFDNTPVHMRWWNTWGKRSVGDLPFVHHELLLGVEDGNLKLQLPVGHCCSYAPGSSSKDGFQVNTEVELPAKMLKTIMAETNVERLEVLKLDVEGAEWALLDSWLAEWKETGLPACQLVIEFHNRLADGDQQAVRQKAVDQLFELGFQLAHHVDKSDGADDNLFINTKVCK